MSFTKHNLQKSHLPVSINNRGTQATGLNRRFNLSSFILLKDFRLPSANFKRLLRGRTQGLGAQPCDETDREFCQPLVMGVYFLFDGKPGCIS